MSEWNPCPAQFNGAHFDIELGARTFTECALEKGHQGAHGFGIEGPKFGYVARIEWADAFPDIPIPEGEDSRS